MTSKSGRLVASRRERTIAVSRIVLAASSLFAVWIDPTEPVKYAVPTYMLHTFYLGYSLVVAGVMWNRPSSGRLPIAMHVADIFFFSVFPYLTPGPSSPFYVYFVFAVFCAALRWDWRGTLATSIAVLVSQVVIGVSMSQTLGSTPFELNRFVIRSLYLAITSWLLVYLGQHEKRLRAEIERLARWPPVGGLEAGAALDGVLEHAAHIVGAPKVVAVWEVEDEPWIHVASWASGHIEMSKHGPEELAPIVPEHLSNAEFLCTTALNDAADVLVTTNGVTSAWTGLPLHPGLLKHVTGGGVASAPFQTDRVLGRAFFCEVGSANAELLALTAVVAREVGTSLDQLEMSEQLKEIAAREQRIRLARDLHDGVLQSLTGMRFELQGIATEFLFTSPAMRDRLVALERALAIEQRELRLFIDELKPMAAGPHENVLMGRLDALRERIALEWKVPVTIRVNPPGATLSASLEQAVPLMAHEAIVNALKYARPSRISVDIDAANGVLRMAVSDDGCGFPFKGRYEHAALAQMNLGPVSLRERATSLGGQMTIDSTATGSRVEIAVPVGAGRP